MPEPMTMLARQRCFHHSTREAVSRCPRCQRYFCRECITEHDGKVMCSACLAAAIALVPSTAHPLTRWLLPLGIAAGLLLTWLFFYYVGVALTRMPASVHEDGT